MGFIMRDIKLLAIDCLIESINHLEIPFRLIDFDRLEEVADQDGYAGVLLGDKRPSESIAKLIALRSYPPTCLLPIYVLDKRLARHPLSDGILADDMEQRLQDFQERKHRLAVDPFASRENRLLSYLWLLDGRLIAPSINLSDQGIYRHDLLELWLQDNPESWIKIAQRNNLIKPTTLIDRLRLCHVCHGAHLNYVDVCPHCASIDIVEERAIHCFNCGHVANQERFLRQEKLVCPKCLTPLKHIGSDYDRPIENHRCNHCDQMFIDAKVVAACLHCGHHNEIDRLLVRGIHGFGLDYNGDYKLREGHIPEHVPIALGEPLSRSHFTWMLKWLNLGKHVEGKEHTVLGLHVVRAKKSSTQDDQEESADRLEDLCSSVRGLLSSDELFSRFDDESAILILPFSGLKRTQQLSDEISHIESSRLDKTVELYLAAQALPCVDINIDADRWMDKFMAEIKP